MAISFGDSKKPFVAAIVVLSLLAVGLLIAVIVLALPKEDKIKITETNYCFKSQCLKAASELQESINSSVPPCQNFYEHTCGTWLKNVKFPPGQGRVGVFSNVQRVLQKRLTDLLKESPTDDEPDVVKKAKTFFQSCMDLKSIDSKSVGAINEVIQKIKGATNLVDLGNLLLDHGSIALIPTYVFMDSKNVSRNIINVGKLPLMLGAKRYYNRSGEVFTKFKNMIAGFSAILTGNPTDDIINLEWKFKDIYPEAVENASASYNLMPIKRLENLTQGQVKWLTLFERGINNSGSTSQINENTTVLVNDPEYIKKLADILNSANLDILKNFAAANYIVQNINAMPTTYRDLYNEFIKAKTSTESSPRDLQCTVYVRSKMPNAVGRLYIDHYFPASSKKLALKLVLTLQDALEQMFKENKWMDEKTRLAAIEKVKNVIPNIGYGDSLKDDEEINKPFKGVNFTENEFMRNVIKVDLLTGKEVFKGLDATNKRTTWKGVGGVAVVNAMYMATRNAIYFPAGILQAPVYDEQYPLSILFGTMGSVVGHEFTHGFDNTGAQYDKIGDLKNWWTPQSMQNFIERAAGLKKEYAAFPICKDVPGCNMKINENQTIGENIADTGGIKAAFKAYKEYVDKYKVKQLTLPGLDYTSDQLFFIGFAHLWCSKLKPNALMNQLLTDVHSPDVARVIVTLQNSEAFAKAFKCKENSPMNPKEKYGVW